MACTSFTLPVTVAADRLAVLAASSAPSLLGSPVGLSLAAIKLVIGVMLAVALAPVTLETTLTNDSLAPSAPDRVAVRTKGATAPALSVME